MICITVSYLPIYLYVQFLSSVDGMYIVRYAAVCYGLKIVFAEGVLDSLREEYLRSIRLRKEGAVLSRCCLGGGKTFAFSEQLHGVFA